MELLSLISQTCLVVSGRFESTIRSRSEALLAIDDSPGGDLPVQTPLPSESLLAIDESWSEFGSPRHLMQALFVTGVSQLTRKQDLTLTLTLSQTLTL